MDSGYQKELKIAFEALQTAAQLSNAVVSSQDKVEIEKDDLSPVTVGDFAVQALLVATFRDAFPNDKFVGEEDASHLRNNSVLLDRVWQLLETVPKTGACQTPSSKEELCAFIDLCGSGSPGGAGSGRTWVFDPIDGTRTFMLGQVYAINVALLVDGKQTLSAVGCPNTSMDAKAPLNNEDIDSTDGGCILFGVKGHGAFVRTMNGSPEQAPVRKLSHQAAIDSINDVKFVTYNTVVDSALHGIHEVIANRMGVPYPGCDLLPWVLRWAMLAMGLGNTTIWVYKRIDRFAKVWDHAGAMLLYEETGGKITDVHGKPIDLSVGRKISANFGFVAAPPSIHDKVLGHVQAALRQEGHDNMLQG